MSQLRRIPIPLSAVALGAAALGNLLLPYSPALRAVCGVASALLALLVILRLALDYSGALAELRNPATLAVFPTFFMALMLLATYLKPFAAAPALALWVAALVLQLCVSVWFIIRFVTRLQLAQVLPSWFLIFVGFVVGAVTSPAFGVLPVGRALLLAGLVGYGVALALVIARLVKVGRLPEPALATTAIFAAPPSLCLVGYLQVAEVKQPAVVYALLAIAAVSVVYALTALPRVLRFPFYPSIGALTFPFVISAIALKQSNVFLSTLPAGSPIPKAAIVAMDAFAAAMVVYALVRYVAFLAVPAKAPEVAPEASAS